MLNKQSIHTLFGLDVEKAAPTVLIYAETVTVRLDHVCRFMFNHVLKLRYSITENKEDLKKDKGQKINYSQTQLENCIQVIPQGLLTQKGISELRPVPFIKENVFYVYENANPNPGAALFHFDIFSAVFYFISRYEEWQSFEPDSHGRFEAAAGILYKNQSHLKPVVDIWILELAAFLQEHHAGLVLPKKEFKVISTIDVDNLFAYKAKGWLRTMGASAKDILKADLVNLKERLSVLTGKKPDPFDIYQSVSDFCFEKQIPLIYFFLFRTGTTYDRTVNPSSPAYTGVFKTIKENHALMGLHPSYHSSVLKDLLRDEVKNLSEKSGEAVSLSRQHYLRFDIRSTPGLLAENGIIADFSMGFASVPGFRAGTSHPFYYYDFHSEQQSELLFVPFCVMDGVYTVYEKVAPETAHDSVMELAREVKKVNGLFISVFHERTFSDHLYPGFDTLYKKIHLALKDL